LEDPITQSENPIEWQRRYSSGGLIVLLVWRSNHWWSEGVRGRSPEHHSSMGEKMDTKPKDDKPTDLDLELAVFGAP